MHTDEGITGLGETFYLSRTVEEYLHEYVAPRVIGRDPLQIDLLSADLVGYLGFRSSGAEVRGNSAFDIALWDIFGKATGQPVAQLLGGFSRQVDPHLQHLRRHRIHQGRQGPERPPTTASAPGRTMTTSTASCIAPASWPRSCSPTASRR